MMITLGTCDFCPEENSETGWKPDKRCYVANYHNRICGECVWKAMKELVKE